MCERQLEKKGGNAVHVSRKGKQKGYVEDGTGIEHNAQAETEPTESKA